MSWTPPARPPWVRAANAGEIPILVDEAAAPLTTQALVAEVATQRGVSGESASSRRAIFDHPDFCGEEALGRLSLFLRSLEEQASLSLLGRIATRRFLLRLLDVRAGLLQLLRSDPAIASEDIREPIFVAGAPRTGTTILHQLLSADPAHRVPEGWELLRPVPPPSPDPDVFAVDPRIDLAHRELAWPQTVVSGLLSAHEYGGRKPKECLSAMSFSLLSEEFTARYSVPDFETYLLGEDMTPAYQMHRLVLQVLQRRFRNVAWVLKSPVHLHSLPTLLETYPDAHVIITHRDPNKMLSSLTSLIAQLRYAHSDQVDIDAIAQAHFERYSGTFEKLINWTRKGTLPPSQTHHSLFDDFQTRPIEAVASLYEKIARPWTPSLERSMKNALDGHSASRHGEHRYEIRTEMRSSGTETDPFERYRAEFGIPTEQ